MAEIGWKGVALKSVAVIGICFFCVACVIVLAEHNLKQDFSGKRSNHVRISNFLRQEGKLAYEHVWPVMKFGWRLVVGTIIGFFGASFGSVGGVGGGGIFVPMLTLIIGFDPKSSTAISKCMIMGAACATVYYNLKRRHPTLDLPVIDYDLALLFQPMLLIGISIGVAFNVIFADWMVTGLLIIIFIGASTKAFIKGVKMWKKESLIPMEAAKRLASGDNGEVIYKLLPGGPSNNIKMDASESKTSKVSIIDNVYWRELGILVAVWVIILALQISKNHTKACSPGYWVANLLQVPVAFGISAYEAVSLYKGRRVIASKGEEAATHWQVHQLIIYCFCGILAGIVGGLLGLGGGFILGPLFLELGVPPQAASATATFIMTFSSSMSVIQYYLLKRFPMAYAVYFIAVATVAALVGQLVVRKIISILGRASPIIFLLAFTIFTSAVSLGGVGISGVIDKFVGQEYLGFDDICAYPQY